MENPNVHFATEQKHYVNKMDMNIHTQSLGTDFGREEMMEMFPTARTFPQIKVNNENIGGYTELEEKHKGGQL